MKKLLFGLMLCLGVSGCVVEDYSYPPSYYQNGTIEFCDDYGCRYVDSPYYYDSGGSLFYWDAHFGCWIGPHGYWHHGYFYRGYYPGYHGWYHGGWYHGWHGGYYRGGGYHRGHR